MMKVIKELFDHRPDRSRIAERIDLAIGDGEGSATVRELATYMFTSWMIAMWLDDIESERCMQW